jgi:hypothetical protein
MIKKRTITVDGKTILIVSRKKSYCQNPNGYSVKVSDSEGNEICIRHIDTLFRKDAEDCGFVAYVKKFVRGA